MVFCGPLFDMHPRYMHFKDLMMDFFRGQTVETMEIDGLQHVISISAGEQSHDPSSTKEDLPNILFRVYLIGSRKVAGSKVPRIELEEMGPRMDLKLGRWQEPNEEMMSLALKKPKPATVLSCRRGANCRLKRRRMLRLIRWEINLVVFMLVCRI
jgi:ribosome production factor 2